MRGVVLFFVALEVGAMCAFAHTASDWNSIFVLAILAIGIVFGWLAHDFYKRTNDKDNDSKSC